MNRKLPPEAYSHYLGLGRGRSYEMVAAHYGVNKRTVTKLATKEGWQAKVRLADEAARAKAEERAQETIEEMHERHLKTMQLIQKKALETLRATTIESGMDAARALVLAVEKERLIRGEPTERTVSKVEELIKTEYAAWSRPGEDDWSTDVPESGTPDDDEEPEAVEEELEPEDEDAELADDDDEPADGDG